MTPALDAYARPVQCPRCGVWCLLGQVDGFKTAVNATPLGDDGYRAALLAGLPVYRLTGTKRLRRVTVDTPAGVQRLLAHPCQSWASTPLKAPEKPVQARVPCSAACSGSCEACDPAPFDFGALLVEELGAKVVSIEIDGKEVYCGERCCQPLA